MTLGGFLAVYQYVRERPKRMPFSVVVSGSKELISIGTSAGFTLLALSRLSDRDIHWSWALRVM